MAKRKTAPKRATTTKKATASARTTKTEAVLALLRRPGGATAAELLKVTGWQAHSLRGFISGTVGKKLGLAVTSTKGEGGDRTYRVAK